MYTNKTKKYICSVDDLLKIIDNKRFNSYTEMNCCTNQYLKYTLFFSNTINTFQRALTLCTFHAVLF